MFGTCICFTGSSEAIVGLKPAEDQCRRETHETQYQPTYRVHAILLEAMDKRHVRQGFALPLQLL